MIAVLHTFGSDMKYHPHIHTLITFGGLDENGKWLHPKRRKTIASYRRICNVFRDTFIANLIYEDSKEPLVYHTDIREPISEVEKKRWNVKNTKPSMDVAHIVKYLGKYINRIAISPSRLEFMKEAKQVKIEYNDYAKQKPNQPAPKAYKYLEPLEALNQFLQHVLPPYFQKSRYYGLHHHSKIKKYKQHVPKLFSESKDVISILFSLLKEYLNIRPYKCQNCEANDYNVIPINRDPSWIFQFITIPYRPPPMSNPKYRTATWD